MSEVKTLNRCNNELDKKLTKENNIIMTDMVCYIRAANLSLKNQELIRQDLIEMALSAQERGESLSEVVGHDYKEFCDDIIASVPQMTGKEKMMEILDTVLLCGSILCFITTVMSTDFFRIIKGLVIGEAVSWNISYPLSGILIDVVMIAVAVWIVNYICKTSFESTKKAEEHKKMKGKEKKWSLKAGLFGAMIWIIMLVVIFLMRKTGAEMLFSVNVFAILGAAGLMYLSHKLINANS